MSCPTGPLRWAIFCRVIDNFGDVGVCWRLACDLAQRGHDVRLWLDDTTALHWMAPEGWQGVQVLDWDEPFNANAAAVQRPADVMVEAFGCDIAPEFLAAQAAADMQQPVWVNLEYLSAEPYVERCHALPSLQSGGPATGWTKWFFYPGFTALTGGLLRERNLAARQAQFDVAAWLGSQGLPTTGERRISLFCYEPAALSELLAQLDQHGLQGEPVRLLVAAGRAAQAVKGLEGTPTTRVKHESITWPNNSLHGKLSISYLPLLSQIEFDHLLWSCDLNFVRGEDSLVRALWAGKPWVWHIYPQDDGAHHAKLQALLLRLGAPDTVDAFHRAWNESAPGPLPAIDLAPWQDFASRVQTQLWRQTDLATQLLSFVASKKS